MTVVDLIVAVWALCRCTTAKTHTAVLPKHLNRSFQQ